MNVLLILCDSLNRDYLSCYGNGWVSTPNIDRLAARSVVFDNHYIGSAPCIPARRDLFTGRKEFLWRGWGAMEPFDEHLATLAQAVGAHTGICTDHAHYWDRSHGYGYMQAFEDWEMIRGQEGDRPLAPLVSDDELPQWVRSMATYWPLPLCRRYYRNVMQMTDGCDFHSARVIERSREALDAYRHSEMFFLQVETFDPHEPWLAPAPYRSMYGPYDDHMTCWPPYLWRDSAAGFFRTADEGLLRFVRRQYAAKVTMLDEQLGRLFDTIDKHRLWDDTVVILTTDHGHDLGERGCYGKSYPHWNSHAHIPLIVYHPDYSGSARCEALTTTVDVHCAVRDILNCPGEA